MIPVEEYDKETPRPNLSAKRVGGGGGVGGAEGGLVRFIGKLCKLTTLHILFCLYNANYFIARDN